MTRSSRAVMLFALGAGALYLMARAERARITGVPVFVNPFAALTPGNPSPGGSTGAGSTNPLEMAFSGLAQAFKLPGNTTIAPAAVPSPGTSENPVGPPATSTRTAQPERPLLVGIGDVDYLPNLGDPNFTSFDYLASTPPDAWGFSQTLWSDADIAALAPGRG